MEETAIIVSVPCTLRSAVKTVHLVFTLSFFS